MKTCPQCDSGYPDSQISCPTHGLPLNEIRDLRPGMLIRNTYRIVRKLGQGGMGAVYLAQQELMQEPQALKFLSSELCQDPSFTARFLREVRTLRQIRHKNVVDAGNLEPAEDGTLFFSMEFVDGPDLRTFLNNASFYTAQKLASDDMRQGTTGRSGLQPRLPKTQQIESRALAPEKSLPVELALSIARQIAEGLGAAHAKGMVHRDIKPENILMARDADAWLPKIADFGIVATKESSTAYTRTGGTLLTMAYAAPEQWRGTAAAELDGRTDLYALGGLLYEMLTGQTPFHAENYEGWARQHQTTPPQPPSTLRPDLANWQGLDALTLRLLAKDRNDRPKDVAELLGLIDVMRYVAPGARRETVRDVTAPAPTPQPSPHWQPLRLNWIRSPGLKILLRVAAFACAVGFSRLLWQTLDTKPKENAYTKAYEAQRAKALEELDGQKPNSDTKANPLLGALTWTDPATGLMWTKNDNGSDVNWQQATDYCRNLQLAGYSGWRLPSIDELQGIYDAHADIGSWLTRGNLQLSGLPWSSSQGNASGQAWNFNFMIGMRHSALLGYSHLGRALCVRGFANQSGSLAAKPSPKSDPTKVPTTPVGFIPDTVVNDEIVAWDVQGVPLNAQGKPAQWHSGLIASTYIDLNSKAGSDAMQAVKAHDLNPPTGTTGFAKDSKGKFHFTNMKGADFGVVIQYFHSDGTPIVINPSD